MLLTGAGWFAPVSALQSPQKCARGRHKLIYALDESLQPGVVLFDPVSKRVVIRAVRAIHVTPLGASGNPSRSPSRHREPT
jgi:hypothetical protein